MPSGKRIQDHLLEMRMTGEQMTVVVDEFGGAEGTVSIEDILEEVVEDIQDEYDSEEAAAPRLKRLDDGSYVVGARIDLDDLAGELEIELPKGKYSSLAGFLLDKAGDVPPAGSTIEYKSIRFIVRRSTPRVIEEVQVVL